MNELPQPQTITARKPTLTELVFLETFSYSCEHYTTFPPFVKPFVELLAFHVQKVLVYRTLQVHHFRQRNPDRPR